MEIILKTTDLCKRYHDKMAVDHVSITIARGDIYGFIGRNGAGKTTTMKMVLGLTNPTEGGIELFGGEPLVKARQRIGSLIEAPGIYKNCTAKENMLREAILCGKGEQEIDDLLSFVGLGGIGNKKAGAFSLGMKQRLGIALSLLGDPELLILDEPINGLDPEGIKEIRDLILRLNKEKGVTFLISSHLLDELAKVVTKYGIINNGVLTEEISADDLMKRCESGLKVVVDDLKKAEGLLAKSYPSYKVKDGALIIDCKMEDAAKINALLVKGGVSVSELTMLHGAFEQYFIERIGA